jgi:alkaline phosphatase
MTRRLWILLLSLAACQAAEQRARNVVLFLGDAGGIPTLHAASLHGYGAPQKLFIHQMPHHALMETSTASAWVTDSAAGMTAIVTGQKTQGGVISQSAAAIRGKKDGEPLKTILEYAEERGLSTGVITNSPVADATPAACYAHANDRKKSGEIFVQILKPRFGDGVDIVIGPGRKNILAATEAMGLDIEAELKKKGYAVTDSVESIPASARRVVALLDSAEFDLDLAVTKALAILSKNPKGYFLMVESDLHTNNLKRGLDRAVEVDKIVRKVTQTAGRDTLVIFTADHSFDLRVRGGKKGEPILNQQPPETDPKARPVIRVDDGHTGEEVLVAAQGPGAERVKGFIANTDLFRIMMAAYGW